MISQRVDGSGASFGRHDDDHGLASFAQPLQSRQADFDNMRLVRFATGDETHGFPHHRNTLGTVS